jgi:hypothetical protein
MLRFLAAGCFLALLWYLALQPITYFVMGREVGVLPLYIRAGDAMAADECRSATARFNYFYIDGARYVRGESYCEEHPRILQYGAMVLNISIQLLNWARGYPGCMEFTSAQCATWQERLRLKR